MVGRHAVRLCGLYLPNGNPAPGPKYDYKLAWMERLRTHAKSLLSQEFPLVLAGDYNVIPRDVDCHDPRVWTGDALFQPETRAAYRALLRTWPREFRDDFGRDAHHFVRGTPVHVIC